MNQLVFNGVDLATYGVYIDSAPSYGTPVRDVEYITIPGRSGSLSYSNNRFDDLNIRYRCYIRKNFIQNYRALESFLYSVRGFARLESNREPDYYRMAAFDGVLEPETTQLIQSGFFDINFRCHPQRWLKSGEEWYNVTFNMENPTLFNSYPIIRMYGNGSLMVNSVTITVTDSPFEFTDVDCETMNASYYTSNANAYVFIGTDNRISLNPGSNGFENTGFSKVEIMPRWYEI